MWIGLGLAPLVQAFLQRRLTRTAAYAAATVATWVVLMVVGH